MIPSVIKMHIAYLASTSAPRANRHSIHLIYKLSTAKWRGVQLKLSVISILSLGWNISKESVPLSN